MLADLSAAVRLAAPWSRYRCSAGPGGPKESTSKTEDGDFVGLFCGGGGRREASSAMADRSGLYGLWVSRAFGCGLVERLCIREVEQVRAMDCHSLHLRELRALTSRSSKFMQVIRLHFILFRHQSHQNAYEGLGPHLQHGTLILKMVLAFWSTAMKYCLYLFSQGVSPPYPSLLESFLASW